MKLSDSIDYLRTLKPRIAVPVHDHADVWTGMATSLFRSLGPDRMRVVPLRPDESTTV